MSSKSSATAVKAAATTNPEVATVSGISKWLPYILIFLSIFILIILGIVIYATQTSVAISWTILAFYTLAIILIFVGFIWISVRGY